MEIPSYFRRYLRNIQPTIPNRERAISLHTTLQNSLQADEPFQDWYSGTFLYGSYHRNTAIQPIKDVDICVVLDINHKEHTPESVVRRLRRVVERNGYDGKTSLQRRSVRIDMSGTTLDVVPVVAVNGLDKALLIPDRTLTEWVKTHPKEHLAAASRLNDESNKRYIPFVKIVKAWYRYKCDGVERPKPKGFTLEALVAQYQDADAPTYAERFVNFLDNLWLACGHSLEIGIFPTVPDPGIPGENLRLRFTEDEVKEFADIVKTTLVDAKTALSLDGTYKEAATAWQAIFGPKFPVEPERAIATMSEVADAGDDPEFEQEVADIDLPKPRQFGNLKLTASVGVQNGGTMQNYPSGSRALTKNMYIRFSVADTPIREPYTIRWTVKNSGKEAEHVGDMGHVTEGGLTRGEHTRYRGTHTMTCELLRDDTILARAKHVVTIK